MSAGSYMQAIVGLLRGGFGTAFIPEYTVRDLLQTGQLVALSSKGYDVELQSGLLCSASRWINPVMQAFIQAAEGRR